MKALLELTYTPRSEWGEKARDAFSTDLRERYPRVSDLTDKKNDEKRFQLRVNGDAKPGAVPYAALIPPDQDLSGGYGGMSFVMFPADEDNGLPSLLAMVVGTNGLAPDEMVLGRPGHGRKCAAIASYLNQKLPGSTWAKRDPVRIDLDMPRSLKQQLDAWSGCCQKYGRVLYAMFVPPTQRTVESDQLVLQAVTAFVDLFFDEREMAPKKAYEQDMAALRRNWMAQVLPTATDDQVADVLGRRRFAILEGPPGTGKTEMARRLLTEVYGGRGTVIQFHPGTTYETFVGGLAPRDGGALGFTFHPTPGHLMKAAQAAADSPEKPYLLVIDEINRADLSKVLGEAIYLFEPDQPDREVQLPFAFDGFGDRLRLPPNLHVLGTMNTADRSIAILDVAVRRRFAFIPLWPQLEVVEKLAGEQMRDSFHELLTLFIEHASEDALPLTPGHAYFLAKDEEADSRLGTSVRPLLEEYLAQGYVAGFADEIRAYIARLGQGA
ncbi:MAG: AAA family ATPase [Sumerlaeia bacterium]